MDIPEELLPEILSGLPSKSLVRFRCVSKSWLSLITDPDFCRLHLGRFKNNVDETHLLVVDGSPKNCFVKCSETFETKSVLQLPVDVEDWFIHCSIDELVLLEKYERNHRGFRDLKLWNPSIKKVHDFPPVPVIKPALLLLDMNIGLGYDPLVKDYKHVKLIFNRNGSLHSVAFYNLRAGMWKISDKGFFNWHWDCQGCFRDSVYLKGCLYFLARDEANEMLELVPIDLSSEMFSSISLPIVVPTLFCEKQHLALVDGGCSLALCDIKDGKCVWVLESSSRGESEVMTWTKRYSFGDLEFQSFLYITKNSDMLLKLSRSMSFELATGTKVARRYALVSSYNLKTGREEWLQQQKEYNSYRFFQVFGYTESLTLLK